jgi:hypothetical protein
MGDLYLESVEEVKQYQSALSVFKRLRPVRKKLSHLFRRWREKTAKPESADSGSGRNEPHTAEAVNAVRSKEQQ